MRIERIKALGVVIAALSSAVPAAAQINNDVAMTPHKGGHIFRLQYIYSQAGQSAGVERQNTSTARATYVHGWNQDLAFILSAPYQHRRTVRLDSKKRPVRDAQDGISDLTFLAKYRFWQDDRGPGETLRWAVVGGLNVRSGDSDFSSDSYNPILGTVFTWKKGRGGYHANLIYQINTGRDRFRDDVLRYDTSFSYRLFPAVFEPGNDWELDAVAELNGKYIVDGSHEVFLSPGLQFIRKQWILETSVQIPVFQDLRGPESDYRFVIGLRFQW